MSDFSYSKYFKRTFAMFMDNLTARRKINRPQIKDSDIESFFIYVTELKARVKELEEAVAIHCFEYRKDMTEHNRKLLYDCRLTLPEAHTTWSEIENFREHNKDAYVFNPELY